MATESLATVLGCPGYVGCVGEMATRTHCIHFGLRVSHFSVDKPIRLQHNELLNFYKTGREIKESAGKEIRRRQVYVVVLDVPEKGRRPKRRRPPTPYKSRKDAAEVLSV